MRGPLGLAVAGALAAAGCGGGRVTSTTSQPSRPSGGPAPIHVASPAFAPGGTIPRQYTCDGRDVSPPLRWSGVPSGARSLSLEMRDPDAPGGNFIHWAVSGIPATTTGLASGQAPAGAVQRRNSFGTIGYRGPCPPGGDPAHHYVISVTAHAGRTVLATGRLTGTYARR